MRNTIASLSFATLILGSASCSKKSSPVSDPQSGTVSYNVNMSQIKFGLLGASAFTMTVDGCASGYSSQVTETSPSIVVYKFDENCLAKLTGLTIDTVSYVPSANDPFDTYIAGDKATFEDANGSGSKIYIQVLNQLDSKIPSTTPSHGVDYAFSTIEAGPDQDCTGDCIQNDYSVSVNGVEAPAFDISKFAYVDMTANGAGVFSFKFQCSEALVGTDSSATCKGVPLSALKYKLVADTFNGTLAIQDASEIMSSSTQSIDIGEVIAAGSDAEMPFGGFESKLMFGPDKLHENPNMIMVLETQGTSYKYWNVDVTPIFQQ